MDSSAIAARVKSGLLGAPDINALQINAKIFKNVVELSGFVDSFREKQRAVAIARNVPGVVSVKAGFVVKAPLKHKS